MSICPVLSCRARGCAYTINLNEKRSAIILDTKAETRSTKIMIQTQLTRDEIRRVPIGNQNNDDMSLIEYEMLKGKANRCGVRDWLSAIDFDLTYEENISLLEKQATQGRNKPTMRELAHLWQFR